MHATGGGLWIWQRYRFSPRVPGQVDHVTARLDLGKIQSQLPRQARTQIRKGQNEIKKQVLRRARPKPRRDETRREKYAALCCVSNDAGPRPITRGRRRPKGIRWRPRGRAPPDGQNSNRAMCYNDIRIRLDRTKPYKREIAR